jgi:hypothetical protein
MAAAITVDLQNPLEPAEMRDRPVGRVDIGDARRIGAASGSWYARAWDRAPGAMVSSANSVADILSATSARS